MDTVEPGRKIKAIVNGDLITSDGNTILGADDKAGITEILCAVAFLRKNHIVHRPLEIVFTREEEAGLFGARNLDFKKIRAKECLVVDRSGKAETIVVASPFVSSIDIEIVGKSAHAGYPDKGINAIKVAANAISGMRIGRIDNETTNNIGIIRGGNARNGVPESVMVHAEARSHLEKKMKGQIDMFVQAFKKEAALHGAKVKILISASCKGYLYSENDPLVRQLLQQWKKMKRKPILEKAGGASDANGFIAKGIKAIDIGYGGMHPHTTREKIKISDMQKIIAFIVGFVSVE